MRLDIEKKLKLEKHSVYGYCFRVGRTEASAIRNKSDYIEYTTQKAGTYFTTNRMKELSAAWNELCHNYERRQSDLVKEVINIVATYCPVLELLGGVIAHMDVLLRYDSILFFLSFMIVDYFNAALHRHPWRHQTSMCDPQCMNVVSRDSVDSPVSDDAQIFP